MCVREHRFFECTLAYGFVGSHRDERVLVQSLMVIE